ncbi:hypothetical protein TZ93_01872 [Streptococcus mitis]|uniref:Uncharacterized protein n=1 Tax=Streptococcus mitis TaxID=28037 RepID=A0A0F2DR81_STRMT|nr:hypothetical protein TZ93_01872 [Streptococcus mitis]
MAKNTSRPEIDSLSFEVENQELFGNCKLVVHSF